MYYKSLLYPLVIMYLSLPLSSALSMPFSGLKEVNGIFYNPKFATPITTKTKSSEGKHLLRMQAPFNAKQSLIVSVYETGSDYMSLSISTQGSGKTLVGKEIGMIDLGRSGDAHVYFRGGSTIYMKKDGVSFKYKLTKKSLKEVRQPFTYLSHKTKVKIPTDAMCGAYQGPKKLKLYGKKKQGSYVVATLKVGSKIEVVLKDGEWYLIKSPFGLIGWAKNESLYHSLFGFAESCVG